MRVRTNIPVSSIDVDCVPMNRATFDLATYLENGGQVPPVHVERKPNGRYRVCDGRHRVAAHRLIERKEILAIYAIPEPAPVCPDYFPDL